MNPRSFVHSLVYLITRSLISSWISTKFVSALLPCMLHLSYYFQSEVKYTDEFIWEGLLHCRLIVAITLTPLYDLHKLSDTQCIFMYHFVGAGVFQN